MNHEKFCKCAVCQSGSTRQEALNEMQRWAKEKMDKFGWYVHYVGDDTSNKDKYSHSWFGRKF